MFRVIITWISFLAMVEINSLANILPINGMNTGQISGFYPNYFVPAGYTFSIWGIIYLLLACYCVAFSYHTLIKIKRPEIKSLLLSTNSYFILSCLLNIGWILSWHYLQMTLSLIVMGAMFFTLFRIYTISVAQTTDFNQKDRFLLVTPISVYFGWITVATIANITAALVKAGWQPEGTQGIYISGVLVLIAGLLGGYLCWKNKTYGYGFSIVWALVGVWVAQKNNGPFLFWMPFVSLGILYTGVIVSTLKRRKS